MLSVVVVGRNTARYANPYVRLTLFAVIAALLGGTLAAVNIVAAPVVSAEQLALMAIIAARRARISPARP